MGTPLTPGFFDGLAVEHRGRSGPDHRDIQNGVSWKYKYAVEGASLFIDLVEMVSHKLVIYSETLLSFLS
jgi:hypothetical protein